jgi:hypothetical protein
MAELGYQEGRNFTFDYIQTPNIEGYEKNYRELATRKVDMFLAVGNEPALRAALSVADGKPIAFRWRRGRSNFVATRHMKAALSAQINKSDRNDARGIAQMMRVGLYRPVHVKTLASQTRQAASRP